MNQSFNFFIQYIQACFYFCRIYTFIGVPVRFYFSRILFSRKRLYGSFTYCGKLAK